MNKPTRHALVIKTVVGVGLTASYFLPPPHSVPVSIITNLLWLWMG